MRLEPMTCTECGEAARGTLAWLPGVTLLILDEAGNAEYAGETDLIWDDQTTQAGEQPNTMRLVCPKGHHWDARIVDAQGLGRRTQVTIAERNRRALSPEIHWVKDLHPIGDPDPWTKLLGTVDILSASFHLEAWEVVESRDGQRAVDPEATWYDLIVNHMTESAGQTVRINGRDYFLVVTPFQR